MITIVDYGAGNIGSIENMIKRIGGNSIITSDPDKILRADKLILPGVGSYDFGMNQLINSGLVKVLNQKVINEKVPILGICLGMQLMTNRSEEGTKSGLSWFNAEVVKFMPTNPKQKIPHMGWNYIDIKKNSPLFKDVDLDRRYYFVHSYYVKSNTSNEILTTTSYINNFVSALEKDNIFGVQFHPEKSHRYGMELLNNFKNL